eukprot:4251536-Amphidinium_carterae.3
MFHLPVSRGNRLRFKQGFWGSGTLFERPAHGILCSPAPCEVRKPPYININSTRFALISKTALCKVLVQFLCVPDALRETVSTTSTFSWKTMRHWRRRPVQGPLQFIQRSVDMNKS